MRKFFYLLLLSLLFPLAVFTVTPPLTAPQGGTGLGTATTTNIGQCLIVSSTAPFSYKFGTCGSGSSNSLTATQVGFGAADNTVTGTPTFTFNSSTGVLSITSVSSSAVTSSVLASSPSQPFLVSSLTSSTIMAQSYSVFVSGNYAYMVSLVGDSLTIIDVSNQATPKIIGVLTDATNLNGSRNVYVAGKYAYVANQDDNSLAIVDVSNPSAPVLTGKVKDNSLLNRAYFVNVAGQYAYVIANADNSMRVIDISSSTNPQIVGGVKDNTNLAGAYGMNVNGRYAYVAAGTDNSLRVIDLINPTAPVIVGGIKDNSLLTAARAVYVSGRYAYVTAFNTSTLAIIDVSNPATTTPIVGYLRDTTNLLGVRSVTVQDGYAYVGAATNNSIDIIDISSSTNPRLVQVLKDSTNLNIPHGIYVAGNYLYAAMNTTTNPNFAIVGLNGLNVATANIGALKVSSINVQDDGVFNRNVVIQSGLNVGDRGINTSGNLTGFNLMLSGSGTSTNFFASGLMFTNANGTSITSTNGNFPGLSFTTGSGSTLTLTSITSTNGNIGTFTFSTAVGTSVTTTNLSVSGALALPADSVTDAMVAGTLTLTGGSINNVPIGATTPNTGVFTSVTTTNLFATTSNLVNLRFTTATGTSVSSTNLYLGGAFTQISFGDCANAATSKVLYTLSTGLFSCGTDQSGGSSSLTNKLIAFGSNANTITSSTNLSFTTSTNVFEVIGTVSSTSALFTRATSTRFAVTTNLSLPSNSISNAFLRQSAGLSVIGRSANSTGNVADITGTIDQVLRVSGTTLGFGSINLASATTTGSSILPISNGGTGVSSSMGSSFLTIYSVSSTWTKPTSTRFYGAYIWCVGGGGGAGGSGTAGSIGGAGAGGGASYRFVTSTQLSTTSSVVVGVAGVGGAAGNNNGTAGGTSSFGSLITCTGGAGGNAANGATAESTAGVGSGGDINGTGRTGRENGAYTDGYRGIGGAAGANQGDPTPYLQNSLANTWSPGGILGMFAGAGSQRPGEWDANSRNGGSGASYGGGGSGGQKVGAGADASGGNGAKGVVVIQELYR